MARVNSPLARAAAAFLVVAGLAFAQTQTYKVPPPREEAGRDPTLAAFFVKLRAAVKAKDSGALMSLVSPDIKNGFGGEDGVARFLQVWQIDTGNSPVWDVLKLILSIGGVWLDDQQYCLPYVSFRFPDEVDAFTHSVVLGASVRLHDAASASGRVIGSLSYDVVEVVKREADWTEIRTLDGKQGFISTAYLYSPVSYRACVMKNDAGEWKIRTLLAGD